MFTFTYFNLTLSKYLFSGKAIDSSAAVNADRTVIRGKQCIRALTVRTVKEIIGAIAAITSSLTMEKKKCL